MQNDRIIIFDTTLRDGEQSPGFSMNMDEKLHFADQLVKLGVDVIEAGFPRSSQGDFDAVRRISGRVKGRRWRARAGELRRHRHAWERSRRGEPAHPYVHFQFRHTHRVSAQENARPGDGAGRRRGEARVSYTSNVEFSPMDATRSDRDYLAGMVER